MHYDKAIVSGQAPLFLEIREFLLGFDGVRERRKAHVTSYVNRRGGLCHLQPTNAGIDVGFFKGVRLEDAYGRLWGSGKSKRWLSLDYLDEGLLLYYFIQAIEVNNGLGPT